MSTVYLTQQIGSSSGGISFESYRGTDGAVVKSITVWGATSRIKAIKLTFTDGSTRQCGVASKPAGEGDLQSKSFTFNTGERITSLSLWGNGAGTASGWIKFITTQNREFSHGMYKWGLKTEYKQDVSSGIFVGFHGRANLDVDALGIVFLRPLSGCTLTSVQYPSLQFTGTSATSKSKVAAQSKSITLQNINEANQNLQTEMNDEVVFTDEYSKWSLSSDSKVGLLQFWSTNIGAQATIPVLTVSGNQVGWTTSTSTVTSNTLSPDKSTSNHPWTRSFSLVPRQTSTVSADAYSGKVTSLSFTGSLKYTTSNGGSFSYSTGISGSYDGQTYLYEPITS